MLYEKEGDLFNDLECLCMNTKFGLINYEQIYNLIIAPFQAIIQSYYIELMEAKLQYEQNGYTVFSNIVEVYKELIKIKAERMDEKKKKYEELEQMQNDKKDIYGEQMS